jgi:hypothetical protein
MKTCADTKALKRDLEKLVRDHALDIKLGMSDHFIVGELVHHIREIALHTESLRKFACRSTK